MPGVRPWRDAVQTDVDRRCTVTVDEFCINPQREKVIIRSARGRASGNEMTFARVAHGILCFVLCAGGVAPLAYGAPVSDAPREIGYLLQAVRTSSCRFYRNGIAYDGGRAEAHLRRKWALVSDAGSVATAEEFIESVATRSSLTQQPYLMRCTGQQPVAVGAWLTERLRRYRHCVVAKSDCEANSDPLTSGLMCVDEQTGMRTGVI